jgi:hypothetical protein
MTYPVGYPAPQARRAGLSGRIIALIVVGAVTLFVGCIGLGVVVYCCTGPDTEDARKPAELFLTRIEAGDDQAAYRSQCTYQREEHSQADFTAAIERTGRPVSHRLDPKKLAYYDEAGNHTIATVTLTGRDGTVREAELDMARLDDVWTVCDDDLLTT